MQRLGTGRTFGPGRRWRLSPACRLGELMPPCTVSSVPADDPMPLALTVGCTFGFDSPQPVSAVLQVAPSGAGHEVRGERWDTGADHHGYRDLYGNRCERLVIPAGRSRIVYEADVQLASPRDRI